MNDKVGELLEKLAVKLGVTVDHLWAVLVKQVHNQMIACAIGYFILIVATIFFGIYLRRFLTKTIKEEGWDWTDHPGIICPLVMGGVFVFSFWVIAYSELSSVLAMINNPEYIALKNVLSIIGGG